MHVRPKLIRRARAFAKPLLVQALPLFLFLTACEVIDPAANNGNRTPSFQVDPKEESALATKEMFAGVEDRSAIQSTRSLDSVGEFIGTPVNIQIETAEETDSTPPSAILRWEYEGKVNENLHFAIEASADSEEGPYTLVKTVDGDVRFLDESREVFAEGKKFFKIFVFDDQYYSPDSDAAKVAVNEKTSSEENLDESASDSADGQESDHVSSTPNDKDLLSQK